MDKVRRALLILATVAASAAQADTRPPAPTEPPNILFIAVDDLKPMLGCYGDKVVKTPQIDELASRGTVFLNAHCQQAVCGPSRASLLTGLRPDRTRVWDLKTKIRDENPDVVTLPQYFKQHGYSAVGTGKIFDPRSVEGHTRDDPASWSRPYVVFPKNSNAEFGVLNEAFVERVRKLKADGIQGGELKKALGGTPPVEIDQDVPDNAYDDGRIADTAIELLRELAAEEAPFFLAVGFKKPHLPFVAPKRYADLYARSQFEPDPITERPEGAPSYHWQPGWELRNGSYRDVPALSDPAPIPDELQITLIHGYHACVSYVDAQIGRLLNALQASGKADNTIVVLWGDHGWHLGDHGMWCKHTNYEQATRAPLIIADLRKATGQQAAAPVEFLDIYPTLCELARLPVPEELEGVSLVPVLNDPTASVKPVAISQFTRHVGPGEGMGYAYRDARYRYIEWVYKDFRGGETGGRVIDREFYDYGSDPLETRNLIDDPAYADEVGRMERIAISFRGTDRATNEKAAADSPDEVVANPSSAVDPTEGLPWRDADELVVYHEPPEGELLLHVFKPSDWKPTDRRPALVSFHGGGWRTGNPRAFYWHSNYFASRGMVCICPEYRIESKHGTSPVDSTRDAMRAMQYIRTHAAELGIDPERIAAAGGSAGGQLAAATAMIQGLDDQSEGLSGVSPRPNALVLFNPVLDTTPLGFGSKRITPDSAIISPITQMQGTQPPTIIFNGAQDKTATLERARAFAQKMHAQGNRCDVVVYPDAAHSFFHRGKHPLNFADTVSRAATFLESLGWLDAAP